MALESLVWLPAGSEAKDHQAKALVRAKATAWSHQSGERKGNVSVSKPWQVVQNLAPDHFLQFPVGASAGRSSHNAARQAERRKTTGKQRTQPRVCDTQPLLYQPALSGDERFGRRLHFVLPRFGAIAGEDGLEWLSKFSKRKENVLLQGALGALISGLDFKSNPTVTRRCCAEILPQVRHWLSSPCAQNSHDTLALIFLLSFHELLVWNNAKAWMTHLWGMSEIMRRQEPRSFSSPSALMTFRWYRHFAVALDILLRRASFLADSSWIHEPWRDHGEKDLVDYAVDVLVHIPGMIERVDCILAGRQAAESLQENIAFLINALHDWRVHRLDPFVLQKYGRTIDLDTLVRSITEKTLVDAFLARAIVLHLTTWLFLTRLGQEDSLPWSARDTVDNILDICEEYSYHQEGAGILPWTFSIRAALFTDSTMASAMQGRDLCARLESRFSLGMLSDIIGSLPGLNTKMEFDNASDTATPPRAAAHEVPPQCST